MAEEFRYIHKCITRALPVQRLLPSQGQRISAKRKSLPPVYRRCTFDSHCVFPSAIVRSCRYWIQSEFNAFGGRGIAKQVCVNSLPLEARGRSERPSISTPFQHFATISPLQLPGLSSYQQSAGFEVPSSRQLERFNC